MPKTDKLFELIESLDKGERAWICKCFRAFGQTNNLILFEYLEQQECYDKQKLVRDLRHEGLIKYLSVQKISLYNAILRYLRLASDERGSHYELWNNIIDFSILSEKGLQHHILKKLEKSNQLAKEEAQYHQYIKLLSLKRDILINQQSNEDIMDTIDELGYINDDFQKFLELIDEIWKYRFWAAIIKKLIKKAALSNEVEKEEELFETFNHFLVEKTLPKNPVALFYYYQVHILFYTYQKDFINAFGYVKKQLEYVDDLTINTPNAKRNKLSIFINVVTIGTLAKQPYEELASLINQIDEFLKDPTLKPILNTLLNEFYTSLLNYYNYQGYFEKSADLVEKVINAEKQGVLKKKKKLLLALAGAYFIDGSNRKALDYIDRILLHPKKEISPDIYFNAAVMQILIELDQKSFFYVESLLRSLKHFLKKHQPISSFTKSFITFLSTYLTALLSANKTKAKTTCTVYYEKHLKLSLEDIKHLNFVNSGAWVYGKINDLSVKESLKQLYER